MKYFMFVLVVAAALVLSNVAVAQNTLDEPIQANVVATPLALSAANGAVVFDNLRAGICYTAIADPGNAASITPVSQLNPEDCVADLVTVTGDASVGVHVDFILPDRLYPTGAGTGWVDMTYSDHSACLYDAANSVVISFFNPTAGYTGVTAGDGTLNLGLAGNPCVSQNATADTYQGECIISAVYTGAAF